MYDKIQKELGASQNTLEIGAGAGISGDFLKNNKILKTDILSWEGDSVIGNINAEKLPFQNCEFENILAIDMIHHARSPYIVLNECLRVLKVKGKIIIVEPYVSVFSYFIYKIFHHEDTSWRIDLNTLAEKVNEPFEGNQGISKELFKNEKRKSKFLQSIDSKIEVEIELISFLSFFATGGLSKPLKTPRKLISVFIKIERKMPQVLFKMLASRIFIVIKKIEGIS
jgi:SAM-dependent methyltransferase